jgi:hypothetical protein
MEPGTRIRTPAFRYGVVVTSIDGRRAYTRRDGTVMIPVRLDGGGCGFYPRCVLRTVTP